MEVRYISPEEAVAYLKISAASFIWNFDPEVDKSVEVPVLGAFDEGKLIAGVEIFDFKTNYCGKVLNAVVASGVCSIPEKRRTGGVREIFNEIGKTAVENDITFGFLRPFSIFCYEKFGYANLNRMFAIRIPLANMTHIPRNTDVELYTGEQLEEICKLHNKCAFKENLLTLREDSKHFCDKPLEESVYTYLHRISSGEADGYVRFKVNRSERILAVQELFVLNKDALYGLLGFLRNYDGLVNHLRVRGQYQGSPLSCIADRIDDVVYEPDGGVAGRIYNLKKLLESNTYPEKHGKFRLLSLDELEQNKGIFEVEYENGIAAVTRTDEGEYDISLTPPAAARLMLAGEGHNAQTASFIDGVEINGNADDFFRAFPYRATCFYDSFWST
ncbi:MAG: GNAT family N-acetyltransferase [Clostridia bacterium]|nr:GNAT family N-acetyltransferase [Clostridia bacterium]